MRGIGVGIGELLVIVIVIAAIVGGIFLYRKQLQKKKGNGSQATSYAQRFCPKCGSSLPAGSLACSNCGNVIQQSASNFPVSSTTDSGQLPKLGLAAIICAAVAILSTLLPWFSSGMVSSYTKGITSFLGGAGSSLAFEPSYWAWNAFSLAQTLGNYFALAGNKTAAGSLSVLGPLCTILVVAGVVLMVYGSIAAFKKRSMLCLRIGGLCMLVASCCFFIIGAIGDDIGNMTVLPILCALLSLAVTILAFAVPSKKA